MKKFAVAAAARSGKFPGVKKSHQSLTVRGEDTRWKVLSSTAQNMDLHRNVFGLGRDHEEVQVDGRPSMAVCSEIHMASLPKSYLLHRSGTSDLMNFLQSNSLTRKGAIKSPGFRGTKQ